MHEKCRVRYIKTKICTPETKKRKLTESSDCQSSSDESEARSCEFDFEIHCIICTKKIHHTQPFSVMGTNETKQIVIDYHTKNDTLNPLVSQEIIYKLLCEDDVTVLNAKYHRKNCSSKLRLTDNTYKKGPILHDKIQRSMEEIFNYIDAMYAQKFKEVGLSIEDIVEHG